MPPPKFLDFPEAEYRRRYERIREIMTERQIDAILLTAKENLIYFTGYRTVLYDGSKFNSFICILSRDQPPVMLSPAMERFAMEQTSWIPDVRHWGMYFNPHAPDAISLITKTLKELKLDKGTLGMELGVAQRIGMSVNDFERLKQNIPRSRIIDASESLWKVRSVKSPEEIDRIRRATEITEKGIVAGWKTLREGISEREVARAIQRTMIEEDADKLAFIVTRSGFARMNMVNPPFSDYKLQRGDIMILDLGAIYRDYWSDMTRSASIGPVSEDARKVYNVLLEAQKSAFAEIKGGARVKDVVEAANGIIRKAGYEKWMLSGIGHGLGLEVHEMPRLTAVDETLLEPGMVITIEPSLYPLVYTGTIGNFLVEDIAVVTKNGCDMLTRMDREIYEAT
ncbi:MAG: Xaa-Pro peptidase family protein [Candidatus Bathyarchaeia archaeon]|jgi:Xaa-Pro aminopeptidase